MIPSINAMKRASAYLKRQIVDLQFGSRLHDKIGLLREAMEHSEAALDLMQVDQMLEEQIALREVKAPKKKAKRVKE